MRFTARAIFAVSAASAALFLMGCAAPSRSVSVRPPPLATPQLIVGQRTPGSAPMACTIYTNPNNFAFSPVTREGKLACKANDPLSFRLGGANDYLSEQLCDFNKPMNRVGGEHDPMDAKVFCSYTGRVLDPSRKWRSGSMVRPALAGDPL